MWCECGAGVTKCFISVDGVIRWCIVNTIHRSVS